MLDTPGTATLFAQSAEEALARDALLETSPAVVLLVMDAKNMRRSLALALHVAEFRVPVVAVLNMHDEATRRGIHVNHDLLSERLGVEVVPTVAVEDEGTAPLYRAIERARVPERLVTWPDPVEVALEHVGDLLPECPVSTRGLGLLLLAGDRGARRLVEIAYDDETLERIDEAIAPLLAEAGSPLDVQLTDALFTAADSVASQVVLREPRRSSWLDVLGRWSQHPVIGVPIALVVIAAMYLWVGELGATLVVDAIGAHVFDGFLGPLCEDLVAPIPWAVVRDAIMDPDFGLLPTGLFLAFGILMPVLFFFYFFLGLLQHSGYLPRLSILLDRLMRLMGLTGRGVMPIVMGFSCVTMALVTTRMLETRKQRIIASLILILGLPCAPLLSVLLVILGDMPLSATLTVFGVIFLQTAVAGVLASRIVPGRRPDFIMVLPPMRVPRLLDVLGQTLRQTWYFMREAVPFFLAASFVLFVVDRLGGLDLLHDATRPLIGGLLGLPDSALNVFIKTLIRRESGAAELDLISDGYDGIQLVVTMLVMTFLTPCVNSVIVLAKERGIKVAAILVAIVLVHAVAVGAVVNHVARLVGATFQ